MSKISDLRRNIKGLERARKMFEDMWYKESFHLKKVSEQYDLLYKTLYRITDGEFIMEADHIKVLSINKNELGK